MTETAGPARDSIDRFSLLALPSWSFDCPRPAARCGIPCVHVYVPIPHPHAAQRHLHNSTPLCPANVVNCVCAAVCMLLHCCILIMHATMGACHSSSGRLLAIFFPRESMFRNIYGQTCVLDLIWSDLPSTVDGKVCSCSGSSMLTDSITLLLPHTQFISFSWMHACTRHNRTQPQAGSHLAKNLRYIVVPALSTDQIKTLQVAG